ncbi:MAG: hypothetical protein LBT43_07525 [Prevotella sp.]|jgi:hypothetical protein|nr:hypothetical protein [Prevotella sp.]
MSKTEQLMQLPVGNQIDWKFGLITRTIVKTSEEEYQIHDFSHGWRIANVTMDTIEKLMSGKFLLLELDWE